MEFTLLIITAFIIWFSTVWIAVISLLSFISGWSALGRSYPAGFSGDNILISKFPMSSIKLGFVNYRSCITISFTGTGIKIEIMKLFSLKHKPLFIPYDKISGVKKGRVSASFTEFMIGTKKILFFGKPGDELFSRLCPPGAPI